MRTILLSASLLLLGVTAIAQTARVQVVHNSADLAAQTVDVYVNGVNTLDNFEFRTASPFVDLPAEVEIELAIAPGNSTSVSDALLTVPVTLTDGETYIVVAYGIVSATGYDPAPPLSLEIFTGAREIATNSGLVDVLIHHGATDAPTVDIVETFAGLGTVVDDISATEFQGYVSVPEADYNLEVRLADGETQVAGYGAPLGTGGFAGAAVTVYASGFLDPSQNSNGPAFGLYVTTAAGGPMLALPDGFLGTNDFDAISFDVYPNPTIDELTITGIDDPNLQYSIVDMQGRIVTEGTLNAEKRVDTSALANGLYAFNLIKGTNILSSQKIVKR